MRQGGQPFAGGWRIQKDRRCIWIVTPTNYGHSRAFDDVAFGLHAAFEELGGSAPIVTEMRAIQGRLPIVYGANLLPATIVGHLPPDSVMINLEQASDDSPWMTQNYMAVLQSFPVLDYSTRNRARLASRGVAHAGILGIGYSERLTRITHAPAKDIDVLFYGALNHRRFHILEKLSRARLKVVHLFDVYGRERDVAISRARIVLNLHQYAQSVFEIVRVSYLLANRCCVLSEGDMSDPEVQPFVGGLAIAPYERLVDRCLELMDDPRQREAIAERGFAAFRQISQAQMLMAVMNAGSFHGNDNGID